MSSSEINKTWKSNEFMFHYNQKKGDKRVCESHITNLKNYYEGALFIIFIQKIGTIFLNLRMKIQKGFYGNHAKRNYSEYKFWSVQRMLSSCFCFVFLLDGTHALRIMKFVSL